MIYTCPLRFCVIFTDAIGKEMRQRALCLLTVHRKKPYNNSGSFEKRKEIIFMSHKIIKPEGIELIEYLNNGYAICNRCGAVMRSPMKK